MWISRRLEQPPSPAAWTWKNGRRSGGDKAESGCRRGRGCSRREWFLVPLLQQGRRITRCITRFFPPHPTPPRRLQPQTLSDKTQGSHLIRHGRSGQPAAPTQSTYDETRDSKSDGQQSCHYNTHICLQYELPFPFHVPRCTKQRVRRQNGVT